MKVTGEPLYSEMRHLPTVLRHIAAERERQTALHRRGFLTTDCADPNSDRGLNLGVLGEEFGEVCKAVIEREPDAALYAELVQVAAVASAWAEALCPDR